MKRRDRLALGALSFAVLAAGAWLLREPLHAVPDAVAGAPVREQGGRAAFLPPRDRGELRQANSERYRMLVEKLLTEMDAPGEEGCNRFLLTVGTLSSEDYVSLLAELRGRSKAGDEGRLFVRLLQAWAEQCPEVAASALESGDDSGAYRMVASAWARKSAEDTAAWVRSVPHAEDREQAWIGLGCEVAFKNPRQAIEFAREAGVTPGCADFVQLAAGVWAEKEPEEAVEWARQVEDPALREQLLAGIAISWADTDPHAAASLVIDSVEGEILEENALVGIAQRLALQDQSRARGWVEQFPEGRMRERAEAELARISERMDRVAGAAQGH